MNTIIMVCGPAATGKSTLVNGLISYYDGYYYRPCNSFFDLADEKGLLKEQAFELIDDIDAGIRFEKVCANNKTVVFDQHAAIQYKKDSTLACDIFNYENMDEPYQASLTSDFFKPILSKEYVIISILLFANSNILFNRALNRNKITGQFIRNPVIGNVNTELENEIYFYNQMVNNFNFKSIEVDTSSLSESEVLEIVIQRINEFRTKEGSSSEWTRKLQSRK